MLQNSITKLDVHPQLRATDLEDTTLKLKKWGCSQVKVETVTEIIADNTMVA